GVLIHEVKNNKSLFRYDVRNADINELREFRGSVNLEIIYALADANARVIEYYFENINTSCYEAEMSYDWYKDFGKQWAETLGSAKLIHKEAIDNMRGRGIEVDESEYVVVPK